VSKNTSLPLPSLNSWQSLYFPRWDLIWWEKMTAEEVTVDHKGRVQIPKAIRDRVGLHVGGKARLKIEKENIVIMPPISPEEFIKEMEGCIKEGTPNIDPLKLKKMWEPTEK
jgi:AbrB family looped-hinge helix DNA binding protein